MCLTCGDPWSGIRDPSPNTLASVLAVTVRLRGGRVHSPQHTSAFQHQPITHHSMPVGGLTEFPFYT